MAAIVMNTLNGAVTEYDGFPFQSITPTQAGSVTALYTLGGANDAGVAIAAEFVTPTVQTAKNLRSVLDIAFFSVSGTGQGKFLVKTLTTRYEYTFSVLAKQVSRALPGKGMRENYFGFGFANVAGADFIIDQMDVQGRASPYRRTQ